MKKFVFSIILILSALLIASCATTPKVERIAADTDMDLSGYWNDTDIRLVCGNLVKACIAGSWNDTYVLSKPTVRIGTLVNNSSEHIDTQILASKIQEALLETGSVSFVAGSSIIDAVRTEQEQQQYHAENPVELAAEKRADFLMQGSVRTNVDQISGQSVRTYYVSLELIDVETAQVVWVGNDTVKKSVKRAKYSF